MLCIALIVFLLCCRWLSPLDRHCTDAVIIDTDEDPMISSEVQGKQTPLFISIKPYSLAPALSYCIRTTTIHLLIVTLPAYPKLLSIGWLMIHQ